MQPGETIASAVTFEGMLLVFGSLGTILRGEMDHTAGIMVFTRYYDLTIEG